VSAKKQDIENRNRDLDSLNIQKDRLTADIEEGNRVLEEEKKTNTEVKSSFDTTETHLNQLDTNIKSGRDKIQQLEADILASRQAQIDLDNQALDHKRSTVEVEDKTYYLNDRKNMYTVEIERVDRATLNLKDVVTRHREEKTRFENDRADENARVKTLEGEITVMNDNIREDMKTIDQLDLDKQEVNRNIVYVQTKINDNQVHLDDLKDRADVLERDNSMLKQDIEHLPRDLRANAE
jgi:chromosome segregation ATPase